MLFIVGTGTPAPRCSTWKRCRSSAVAVSGERPTKRGEAPHVADVVALGRAREPAHVHVVDQWKLSPPSLIARIQLPARLIYLPVLSSREFSSQPIVFAARSSTESRP